MDFPEELRHMKIRGRHLHTQRQPPNLQTSCPLWTWKALFPAHQDVDLLADGQCERASHCEQSHREFQHVSGCRASSPSNGSINPVTGRRWPSWHCRRTLLLPQVQKHICLSGVLHPQGDRLNIFSKLSFFGSQMNRFYLIYGCSSGSAQDWFSSCSKRCAGAFPKETAPFSHSFPLLW